jgi:rod shape-determining protein MreB and related proteins
VTVSLDLQPTSPVPPASPSSSASPSADPILSPSSTAPARRWWRPATHIAVDLGTANTVVLVKGQGVVLNEPSVAAVASNGQIKGVGLEAKRMLGRTPEGIRAVRPMKDGVIADFNVAEQMLRQFLKMVLDRHLLRVKPTVIVCVPSSITEVERRAVRDSAKSAGAKRLFMVSEPMAAAIGAGLPVNSPQGSMIVDIGGGTTDIAVIALSGIVCDASIRTAGDELDMAIVQYMRKTYNVLIGEPTAESLKMNIGSALPLDEEVTVPVKGRDLVSGLPRTVMVDSAGIRDAMQESIQRIVNAVRQALEVTPPELASDILDHGIILTGGGAMIRGLDALLTLETGLPVRVAENPLMSVVRGTGIILDQLEQYESVMTS